MGNKPINRSTVMHFTAVGRVDGNALLLLRFLPEVWIENFSSYAFGPIKLMATSRSGVESAPNLERSH